MTDAGSDPDRSHSLTVALWVLLCAGLLEVLVLALMKRSNPFLRVSRDFVWMTPAVLVLAGGIIIAPWVLVGRVWSRQAGVRGVLFSALLVALLDLLMLIPGLSHYAAAALAAGVAARLVAPLARRLSRAWPLAVRTAPVMVVVLAALAWSWRSHPAAQTPSSSLRSSPQERLPNIVLITLDTVRAQSLSLYGYERSTTPALEAFARRGVVFERAFATAPWTLPSHASLFTGRWPHELSAGYATPLDGTSLTLAEQLRARGYRTAGFAANLGYVSAETGLGRGFEHYEDYPRTAGQAISDSTLLRNVADNFRLRRLLRNDEHLNRVGAAEINRRALAWLEAQSDGPFFVFLNYFDAHEPYLPPAPFDRRFGPGRAEGKHSPLHHWLWNRAVGHRPLSPGERREEFDAYDAAIAHLDQQLGVLLTTLERLGALDDAIVVVTADHGEEHGEHGVFEHGYSLYRASLQVPLVIVAPGRVPAGLRVAHPVSLRDVPATIASLTEAGNPLPFPGQSLERRWSLAAADDSADEALLSEVRQVSGQPEWFPASRGDMRAALVGGVRCIRNGDGRVEMYALDHDPWEEHDLASSPGEQPRLTRCLAALDRLGPSSKIASRP